MKKIKTFLLFCLLSLLGSTTAAVAQTTYEATPAGDVADIKTDGTAYVIQQKTGPYSTSTYKNAFISMNGTKSVVLAKATLDEVVANRETDSYAKLYFTFEPGPEDGTFYLKSLSTGQYVNYNNYSFSSTDEPDATTGKVVFQLDGAKGFSFYIGCVYLNQNGSSSPFLDYNTSPSSYFDIIAVTPQTAGAKADFYYFDADGHALNAEAATRSVDGAKTVVELAGLPNYVTATYFTDESFSTEVSGDEVAAAATYYVRTAYLSDFPFVLDGSFFTLGDGTTFLFSKELEGIQRYAVRMDGDWLNGFALSDFTGKNLNTNTYNVSFEEGNMDKWAVAYTGGDYFLQPYGSSDGEYLRLGSTNALLAPTGSVLSRCDEAVIDSVLLDYPTAHYVGTYFRGQSGLTLDAMLAGEGKVQLQAGKYYYLVCADEAERVLTSSYSTIDAASEATDLLASAEKEGFTCAALWQFTADGLLSNANTGAAFDEAGHLSEAGTATSLSIKADGILPTWSILLSDGSSLCSNGSTVYADAEAGSGWLILEAEGVTVPLTAGGDGSSYATLSAPVALQAAAFDDVVIYTAKGTAAGEGDFDALLLEAQTEPIAAGTPIVLVSKSAAASATLDLSDAAGVTAGAGSPLLGTSCALRVAAEDAGGLLTLGKSGKVVGFFAPSAEALTLAANSAYVVRTDGSDKGYMLDFGDGTNTGIGAVTVAVAAATDAPLYDLSGRRVQSAVRGGVYVRGGRKLIVR